MRFRKAFLVVAWNRFPSLLGNGFSHGGMVQAVDDLPFLFDQVRTLVSMLSSEGIWFRPSRQNADQWEEAQATQERLAPGGGGWLRRKERKRLKTSPLPVCLCASASGKNNSVPTMTPTAHHSKSSIYSQVLLIL